MMSGISGLGSAVGSVGGHASSMMQEGKSFGGDIRKTNDDGQYTTGFWKK